MAVREQACVRAGFESAVVPEHQRQIAGGHGIAGADLAQVRVVDQDTGQGQDQRRHQRSEA